MPVPTPGYTAIGLLLVILAIPLGLSVGPLVLGAVLAVVGVRRLHRGIAGDGGNATGGGSAAPGGGSAVPDPLGLA